MLLLLLLQQLLYLHFALGWLGESDLELVVEELRGVEEKWRLIGRELGVLGVDDIMYPNSTDCLREVVRRRLQGYTATTWGHIIVALRKAGEPQVADHLKAKYYPGEPTTSSSQYSLESQHEECILLYCD